VQTRRLYCHSGSFLVRLTVTTDSFNLLSLLLLLELLSLALTLAFDATIGAHFGDLVELALVYCGPVPIGSLLILSLLLGLCVIASIKVAAPSGSLQPEH